MTTNLCPIHNIPYQLTCGIRVCGLCYEQELLFSNDKPHPKDQYKIEYVYDESKHMKVPKKVRDG